MKKIIKFVKKNWVAILLVLIVLGAVFVRVYKFESWLFFQADQVRDAKLSAEAFHNGPEELPLLGPRAAGTFLRLGPFFYYMQYASAVIFNSLEPHVFAYPDLILSLLTIPLLFFFLRHFFSRRNSLLLITVYGFSFIIVQYSRFAWNPNSIAFFGLLFITALYKASQEKNPKKAGLWLLVVALAYSVSSQLHFVAFMGYPVVAFLFWILYFPKKINWKYWVGAFLIGLFLYIPVVLSDLKTDGDNLNQFVYALTAKTDGEDNGLLGNLKQISLSNSMFLTSYGHKDSKISVIFGAVLILIGLGLASYFWKKDKKNRPFVYLVVVWFLVFVLLQIKANASLKPRFFMPIAAVPFIFMGFVWAFLDKFKNKLFIGLIFLSFGLILIANLNALKIVHSYFKVQDDKVINRKIFIKQDDAKVLEYHKNLTDYMANEARKNNKIACFYSSATYERVYEYLFEVYHPDVKYDRISKSFKNKEQCQYFSIITAGNKKRIGSSYKGFFDYQDSKVFGRLEVWNLIAKESFLDYEKSEDPTRKENQEPKEKTDEDIKKELEESLKDSIEEYQEEQEVEIEQPDRKERVFWKHLFGVVYEE
jgi:4-amino-4-deoxy-L-arabinose transferase-like glycosyltransferase